MKKCIKEYDEYTELPDEMETPVKVKCKRKQKNKEDIDYISILCKLDKNSKEYKRVYKKASKELKEVLYDAFKPTWKQRFSNFFLRLYYKLKIKK